jgi:hypothetical protein
MIFNIVTDAVIHECECQFLRYNEDQNSSIDVLFYTDDGVIAGEDPRKVQYLLDLYTTTFA